MLAARVARTRRAAVVGLLAVRHGLQQQRHLQDMLVDIHTDPGGFKRHIEGTAAAIKAGRGQRESASASDNVEGIDPEATKAHGKKVD